MHIQVVMDHSGDTRHPFNPTDATAVKNAQHLFLDLTRKGFSAVALGKDGKPGQLLREFDADVEETLFIPRLQGG
jgi:hypothetical protein